ncbi:MAG: Asp-tRNA(Asn)/Glu-tRNA(Gln) amidotransferase subunit GatB [Erysipelotrichales bacterium]|nr:MAG: Asp-tRNA(Asn)/Glu-tRNA(Gln) amidotransferase subunit GatB [Erysipelotrichales bacterium]
MNYETVIGIEIHCELKTATKMFSPAPVSFAKRPNSCVNEIDLAHPGTLPCVNKNAIIQAIKACSVLNLTIDPLLRFDRKNYYYPDLPKGFQITQQFHPIGSNGHVTLITSQGERYVRINRLHLEEDTAKQFHYTTETWIDFNRAGTPLVEIVSEPDMRNAEEAVAYVEKIRSILYYLGVSDVKMEEGSLRCDINISLRPENTEAYGVKTEIKNLNSLNNIKIAIEAEIRRQTELLESGEGVQQATRRYDDVAKTTVLMRKKEGSVDYKYFPEPNIPPIRLSQTWIDGIIAGIPELPQQRYDRYLSIGLSDYDANVLTQNKDLSDFYDHVLKFTTQTKIAANWCISELPALVDTQHLFDDSNKLTPKDLADMINGIQNAVISSKQAKEVFPYLIQGESFDAVVQRLGLKQVSDSGELLKIIVETLDQQPQSILDYHNGKDRALGFLVGQVMKKSKGQANPSLTSQLLIEELLKRKPE